MNEPVRDLQSARIGVVADTHGNRELLARAREILVEREGIDRAYHLGDDYADAEWMTDWNVPVGSTATNDRPTWMRPASDTMFLSCRPSTICIG